MKCKIDGCEGNVRTKEFCNKHYEAFRRHGDPLHKEKKKLLKKICRIEGCGRESIAKELCGKHYQKLHEHGDPTFSARSSRGVSTRHPLYRLWAGMRQRCTNSDCDSYPNYGGRGITICDEWGDFWKFVDDMGDRPSAHHSIDRINSDGNYEPSNCRWATPKEQAWNKRSCVLPEEHRKLLSDRLRIGRFNVRKFCKTNGINKSAAQRFVSGQSYAPDTEDHAATAPSVKVDFGLLAPAPPLPGKCSVSGCEESTYGNGMCRLHYWRDKNSVSFAQVASITAARYCENCDAKLSDKVRPDALFCCRSCQLQFHRREGCYTQEAQLASRGACDVPGCGKPKHAQGVCRAHYMKAWHAGEVVDLEKLIEGESATLKCEGCSEEFKPEKRNQRFCTSKCYHRTYRLTYQRNREKVEKPG